MYPADLELERLNAYPDTYAVLDSTASSCGWPVHASLSDPRDGWVRGDGPLDRYETVTGRTVELWAGARGHQPYNYLIMRAGSWKVIVPCQGVTSFTGVTATWAQHLAGFESEDGLLVLEDAPPLDMHIPDEGATVRFSGDDVVADISSGRAGCDQGASDLGADDGVVQWCLYPQGGVYVYANAFGPGGEPFLQRLVDGLEIRNYRPAS